jgi:hypothetical protein
MKNGKGELIYGNQKESKEKKQQKALTNGNK